MLNFTFHFGVKDIDNLTTEDIVDKMMNITELCKGKYPDVKLYYLLTNWLAYLYGRIQTPRPDVMPDRREGITRAAGSSVTWTGSPH